MASLKSLSTTPQVAFRKSTQFEANSYAIATWLTKVAQQIAKEIETFPFNKSNLEKNISEFRKITKLAAKATIPKLKSLCSQVGVALVITP
ncbi:hypothetical protein [Lysinibacillus sp. ZYM-1]|uniref:hypothetical protein n=1 Tax=Lysinibacillus sp. ZYM-1 TaxID=1681184 RepID=UPI0006CE78EA|nr:hypothetical protein [Lysinibacillus sp. ZYM-1]KPN96088.1 hypothetical protein AO843_18550 [Lysinibacillus sp. ZYM-1]